MRARTHQSAEPLTAAHWVAGTTVLIVGMIGAMAWLSQGDSLFVTLVQQGLAWCF